MPDAVVVSAQGVQSRRWVFSNVGPSTKFHGFHQRHALAPPSMVAALADATPLKHLCLFVCLFCSWFGSAWLGSDTVLRGRDEAIQGELRSVFSDESTGTCSASKFKLKLLRI